VPNRYRHCRPGYVENTLELFYASYKGRFDEIKAETDPAERDRLIREIRRLAKKARISIPRKMFSGG
jgi:hypothetical protein